MAGLRLALRSDHATHWPESPTLQLPVEREVGPRAESPFLNLLDRQAAMSDGTRSGRAALQRARSLRAGGRSHPNEKRRGCLF